MPSHIWKNITRFALVLVSVLALGNSLHIYAKAWLAKCLIASAWRASLRDQQTHRPWPWADTWPVAKLDFPRRNLTRYVLAGAHGSSLAFGPGHIDGTALPHQSGTGVIGGHRDTHFAFLQELKIGELFLMQDHYGHWTYFRVSDTRVVNSENGPWRIDQEANELHLITCYPFNSINNNGPLRYVVIARRMFNDTALVEQGRGGREQDARYVF